ncbi:hypothetical protein MAM1_0076c04383 [Mucor ambiguus]|uniref:FHA domain-containing protein n=1 Tax=Mucor ambiguus TaxID=91626 RepID=A0A0C9M5N2_9FUNG|nr:hypothetical protein MAM1_0076c04383 [Mucor ambiguus]
MQPGTLIRFCILSNDIPGEESPMTIDTIERELAPSTKIRLGRFTTITDENDIHLNSKVVSRRHAKVYVKENKLLIKDTKSNFGTYVNGVRLAKKKQVSVPRKLKNGDIVRIGKDFHGGINENQRGVLMHVRDVDTASLNTVYTDNNTLVDHDSMYTVLDDDAATLNNESVPAPKQKLAESIITKSDFPSVRIKVVGMNVHPNESDNKQVYSTIISIRRIIRRTREDAINDTHKELWKVEKRYNDFVKLHSNLTSQGFDQPLPSVYKLTNNSPINCDKRILQLELYFKQAMAFACTKDPSYMCAFFSSDIFDETQMNSRASKEGVLSKYKGFLIGGWKSMYFVLEGTKLAYYSCKRGKLLGSISLAPGDVYSQRFNYADPDPTTNCRHGLVIRVIEKRGITDQRVEYQFCAFTDQDRDEWVKLIDKATKNVIEKKEAPNATSTPLLSKLAGAKK